MKYFVSGSTGFVGRALAKRLLGEGHSVHALVRDQATALDLEALGAVLFTGDITDRSTIMPAMEGVDGVYHVAGYYKLGRGNADQNLRVNVEGTRNVLECMKNKSVARGVYTSSLAVFSDTHGRIVDESYYYSGPHVTEYDRTKWLAHYTVAEPMMSSGLPLTIAMPGLVYGPRDTSLLHDTWQNYLRGRLFVVPRGTAYCWSHVEDVVDGHIRAMEQGEVGKSYVIAGPAHTLVEALTLACSITGIPEPRVQTGRRPMLVGAAVMQQIEKLGRVPALYSSEALRSTAGVTYLASNTLAREKLGYNPRPLEVGLPPTLRWEVADLQARGYRSRVTWRQWL